MEFISYKLFQIDANEILIPCTVPRSSAVIDTHLKLKERDKIISENSSLIPFVRY